jgi:hypothetical protein
VPAEWVRPLSEKETPNNLRDLCSPYPPRTQAEVRGPTPNNSRPVSHKSLVQPDQLSAVQGYDLPSEYAVLRQSPIF